MLAILFAIVGALLFAIVGALLNRIRGGWLKEKLSFGRSNVAKLWWGIPTGTYIWWLAGQPVWWMLPALMASSFAAYALLGHGGHMVYSIDWWRANWWRTEQTELTTRFWLVPLFGGEPNDTWPVEKVYLFHLTGMAFIGVLRSLLIVLPLFFVGFVIGPLAFTVLGALLGVIYWIGWRLRDDIIAAELIAGAFYWASLFFLIGENHAFG